MVRLDLYWLFNLVFYSLLNRRRIPLLRGFANEHGLHFQETFDQSQLDFYRSDLYKGGHLYNSIFGVVGDASFVYFEQRLRNGGRESALAFRLSSDRFEPLHPAMFGFLTTRTDSHCFFWWDEYLVPLKELDSFFKQGVMAFQAATTAHSPSISPGSKFTK
jgi:hypothetical protein